MPISQPTPDSKACPHCHARIDHLNWEADYTGWGRAWGSMYPDGGEETDDDEINDSGIDNIVYKCPECEHRLPDDFFEGEDDEEDTPPPPEERAESEGSDFVTAENNFISNSREIKNNFKFFLQDNSSMSQEEKEADEEELRELYSAEYRDFCQLNK